MHERPHTLQRDLGAVLQRLQCREGEPGAWSLSGRPLSSVQSGGRRRSTGPRECMVVGRRCTSLLCEIEIMVPRIFFFL